jgi:hypothetical protein
METVAFPAGAVVKGGADYLSRKVLARIFAGRFRNTAAWKGHGEASVFSQLDQAERVRCKISQHGHAGIALPWRTHPRLIASSLKTPPWWNGRHCGFKIRCPHRRTGSSPVGGILIFP